MMFSFYRKIKTSFSWEGFAIGVILLLGFVLRLQQYLTGRSLWLDEAMLALNIVNRDFVGLSQPLDYNQGAPLGFLLVEKFFNILLGENELVLRFFPFIMGVAALGLFYLLLRHTTTGVGLLAGLTLFAVSPELIYYSSEVKQYIVDVTVTVFLLLLTYPILEGHIKKRNYIPLGLTGVLALWLSHPALFVLAGIGIGIFVQALKHREQFQRSSLWIMATVWLANLGVLYFVSLRGLSQNAFLLDYWQENFMPLPPWLDWSWFGNTLRALIQNQIGLYVPAWLVFLMMLLGLFILFNKNRLYAGIILIIFTFAIIASGLRLYPLGGRLSLFLAPLMIILISQFLSAVEQRISIHYKYGSLLVILLSGYLLFAPASESFRNFLNPKYFEHIRPSMAALAENWKEGDVLFVSNGAVPAFRFYAERYGLGSLTFQSSALSDYSEPAKILSNFKPLIGKRRVWVLITHVYENKGFNEKDYLLNYLDTIGVKKREIRSPGTSVYLLLYDLSPQAGISQ